MKIRSGFVSNSSSTSFTFIFKGNSVEDLCAILPKYASYFDLRHDDFDDEIHRCNVQDIINALRSVVKDPSQKKEDDWELVFPISIDEKNKDIDASEKRWKEYLAEEMKMSPNNWGDNLILSEMSSIWDERRTLKKAQKRGLDCVIEIGFGDSHGAISGPGLGSTMDYEGRHIRINKDDLIVYTRQNR